MVDTTSVGYVPVDKTGDTMTGDLTLSGAPTTDLMASTKKYVDDNISINDASKALDNLASVAINTSLISDTNNTDDLGSATILWKNIFGIGAILTTIELGHATDTTLSRASAGDVNIEGNIVYRAGGTDVPTTDGGTGSSTAGGARTNLGVAIGSDVQAWDTTLDSFAAYNTNGILTQTAANTFVGRTLTGTVNEITVTNGDGVAGVPTFSLPAALTFTGKTITGGALAGMSATTFTFTTGSIGTAVTAVTQAPSNNSTLVATTAYADAAAAGGGATIELNNLGTVAINTSLISDTDVTDDLGSLAIRWNNIYAAKLSSGDTAADVLTLSAYDVDGAVTSNFITLTSNNTPTCVLASGVTGTTQSAADNSTKLATTAYADASAGAGATIELDNLGTVAINTSLISDTTNTDDLGSSGVLWKDVYATRALLTTIELGHATDTTLSRSGAGDVDIEGNIIYRAGGTDVPTTDGGTGSSTAGGARTNLGLVIGTDVQAFDATLLSIAALGSAADKMIYTTGLDTWAETALTTAGRALLDDANAGAQRTTMGVAIGSDVQAWDTTLDSFAAYNTNGIIAQTSADTFVGRTITGTANEITITNGDGVLGNPTASLPAALTFTGKTITGGALAGMSATTFTFTTGSIGTAVTAVTQSAADNSTKLATTAYADASGGGATVELDNLGAVAINTSLISDTDVTDDLGSLAIRWNNIYAAKLSSGDTAADVLTLSAYDVDGAITANFITLTSNNTPTCVIASGVTGTTQSSSDNSTKLATTAYADTSSGNLGFGITAPIAGRYIRNFGADVGTSNVNVSASRALYFLVWVPPATYTRIGCKINTAHASAIAELAVYALGADGEAGARLATGVPNITTTGDKEVTVSVALDGWYILAYVCDTTISSNITSSLDYGSLNVSMKGWTSSTASANFQYKDSAYPLADPAPSGMTYSKSSYLADIWVRVV